MGLDPNRLGRDETDYLSIKIWTAAGILKDIEETQLLRIFDFGGKGRDDLRIVQVKSHGETNHFKVVPNHEQHLITHIFVYAHSFEDGFRYLHAPSAMSLDSIGFA